MSFAVRDQLVRIAGEFVAEADERTGRLPSVPYESDWSSPCIVESDVDGLSFWRPAPMTPPPDFSGLQRALECAIHVDILTYFGSFWSAPLPVAYAGNDFELLQLWNEQDFENLIANLIGHALEKRRVREPLSLFFALVDDARFLSVDNAGGQVFLETVGRRRPDEIAPSLGEFLADVVVKKKSPP